MGSSDSDVCHHMRMHVQSSLEIKRVDSLKCSSLFLFNSNGTMSCIDYNLT